MGTCIGPRCTKPREVGALFCDAHMKAPAVQRGGWISAEKRRRQLTQATPKESPMDMSNVATRLWVGGKPPFDRDLPEFDTLVLCAHELQPAVLGFGRQVVRVPLPDSALTTDEIRRAIMGGREVGAALAAGRRVLVTCYAGLNRSALVASLGLGMVTKMTPVQIITLMRTNRSHHCLHNPHFVDVITKFVGSQQRVPDAGVRGRRSSPRGS